MIYASEVFALGGGINKACPETHFSHTSYILQRLMFLCCLNLVNSKTTNLWKQQPLEHAVRLYISHVFPAHASGDTGCSIRFLALFFAAATHKVVMILVSFARTASTLSALSYSGR